MGYIHENGNVTDHLLNTIKKWEKPNKVIFEKDDVEFGIIPNWTDWGIGIGYNKGKGTLILEQDRITFIRKIRPGQYLVGGLLFVISRIWVLKAFCKKMKGYKLFYEFSTQEIKHVISPRYGIAAYLITDEGDLMRVGFSSKYRRIGDFLYKFRMHPPKWETYQKEMVAWSKAQKKEMKKMKKARNG